MSIYVTIDHSKSFQGTGPWVQATPLEETSLLALGEYTATVILIHGFANGGKAWEPIARDLQKTFPHIKFILPNAPLRTVGVPIAGAPGETILPAWRDPRLSAGIPDVWTGRSTPIGDEAGLLEARTTVNALLDAEAKLVAPGRIVVVGFSQGAGLALAVGLEDERVDGVIALSFELSVPDSFKDPAKPAKATLEKALFWGHGGDDYIPMKWPIESVAYLVDEVGFKKIDKSEKPSAGSLTWSLYEGLKHETNEEELRDIKKWLSIVLP